MSRRPLGVSAIFKLKYGEVPVPHNAKGDDGANMLFRAMNAAPELTGDAMADVMRKVKDYVGVQGKFDFDEKGEGLSSASLGVFKGGQLVPITE